LRVLILGLEIFKMAAVAMETKQEKDEKIRISKMATVAMETAKKAGKLKMLQTS